MLKPAVSQAELHALAFSSTLNDIAEGVLDVIARLLNTRLVAVSRIESTTYTLMAVIDQHHTLRPGQLFNLHDTFCVYMLESGQPLCINDITQAPLPFRALPATLELSVRSYAGVPLRLADGRVFGSLWAADTASRQFTEHDIELLQLMAHLLTLEVERDDEAGHSARIEQVMSMQNNIDQLTGLLTRDSFEVIVGRESARSRRYGNIHALAVLRIVSSAAAEEHHGAHGLDTLRRSLADILMRTSRLVDCCARINEDEFAVLFIETTTSGVEAWHARIMAAIEVWNRVHTTSGLLLDVSIGVADSHDAATWANRDTSLIELAQRRARKEQPQWHERVLDTPSTLHH